MGKITPTPSMERETNRIRRHPLRRWLITFAAIFATTALIYLVSAALPLARPKGLYSMIGVQTVLPILLLSALVAAVLSTVVTALIAYFAGMRRWGYGLVLFLSGFLGFVAFFAGYDSPWFGDRAAARKALSAKLPMYEAMTEHRTRLLPGIEAGDLTSMQAALNTDDPTLTPAQLVCLVRTEVIEARTGSSPPVSEQRYRFLDTVADAAWRIEDSTEGQQAIGLLAIDAALRHGAAVDLQRWLERGVQVHGIHWRRAVSDLTQPAGLCRTVEHWPLNLALNLHDGADKIALLLEHGARPVSALPGEHLFEIAPLSAHTVAMLAKRGLPPNLNGPEGSAGAPLSIAIRMAERRCEGGCMGVFAFTDEEIVQYVEVLLEAGAEPDQATWDGRDAWATLLDVRQKLIARQQSQINAARARGIVLPTDPAQQDPIRTDLLRRIEQILRDAPRSTPSAAIPPSGSSD
ncbi:hypothetical protein [Pseudomonas aeruginosa]|uniref:hypothetical protein n=1 Tax=Pseudomonas aeruginosa TaxID=287 RepID=UPI00053E834D|nr:hypothetical protein [Pseudomonas aeruginosa]HBN9495258.1 hypothetical protein [Pseudomonas aeruginosa]